MFKSVYFNLFISQLVQPPSAAKRPGARAARRSVDPSDGAAGRRRDRRPGRTSIPRPRRAQQGPVVMDGPVARHDSMVDGGELWGEF